VSDEQLQIYDEIMNGGYGIVKTDHIMITGNLEMLKEIIQLAAKLPEVGE
jgi:hypothetical protein